VAAGRLRLLRDHLAYKRAIAVVRGTVAEFFFERLAHAVNVAVLAEDEREDEPVIACAYLPVRAGIAHERARCPGGGIGNLKRCGMTPRGVSAGPVADVSRGEQAAARDGMRRFAHDHAVHDDDVARIEVVEGELLLGGDILTDWA